MAAFQRLPTLWRVIEQAPNVGELWGEIYRSVDEGGGAADEDLISEIFHYESWCISESQDEEAQAAVLNFYLKIPANERLRRALPRYLSVEDFLGVREIFESQLTPEEYEAFRREFLAEAVRLREAERQFTD
jgi:hypothetical protein